MYILGFDIGGTKCAVISAEWDGKAVRVLKKARCETDHGVSAEVMIERLCEMADSILEGAPDSIGISAGGPLDSRRGIILCPPNLPKWRDVEIVKILSERFNAPAYLQNDANACALAEWKFGAGVGCTNMVFLTFGTGMGAGLILNGRLYEGANGNAGEIGHVRLSDDGPFGFGKRGSFEGFCSGGGLKQLGYDIARRKVEEGKKCAYYKEGDDPDGISAKSIADAARSGDESALETYRICGKYLGKGLSVLIDVLNPEKIIIGSIFKRSKELLLEEMKKELRLEALAESLESVEILPAALGEEIGDYGAIASAIK